jgi:hypothetical protein
MSEWQPIESAPKDVAILVCGGTYYDSGTTFGDDYPFQSVEIVSWYHDQWRGPNSGGHDEFYYYKPTHWMSLPETPTSVAAGREAE